MDAEEGCFVWFYDRIYFVIGCVFLSDALLSDVLSFRMRCFRMRFPFGCVLLSDVPYFRMPIR